MGRNLFPGPSAERALPFWFVSDFGGFFSHLVLVRFFFFGVVCLLLSLLHNGQDSNFPVKVPINSMQEASIIRSSLVCFKTRDKGLVFSWHYIWHCFLSSCSITAAVGAKARPRSCSFLKCHSNGSHVLLELSLGSPHDSLSQIGKTCCKIPDFNMTTLKTLAKIQLSMWWLLESWNCMHPKRFCSAEVTKAPKTELTQCSTGQQLWCCNA